MLDENIERLISRRLDGVLADSESVELDRAVLRSPEVRAALDAARRIDDLAKRALLESTPACVAPPSVSPQPRPGLLRRWYRPAAAGLLAAAASVMLAVGWQTLRPAGRIELRGGPDGYPGNGAPVAGAAVSSPVAETTLTDRYAEVVNREVLGVYDEETRSLYLLEIDRSHMRPVSARASY